jgi:hypothetical protein
MTTNSELLSQLVDEQRALRAENDRLRGDKMRANIETMRLNGLIMLAQSAVTQFFNEGEDECHSVMRDLQICLKSLEEHRHSRTPKRKGEAA